jgi:N-hydroxyarylamine O-acetyltransferase
MLEAEVDAYLARIGAARPERPDAASLRQLQHRHLLTVPFENLSIHLGEPILLDGKALHDKLVGRRRGGFCYELNGAFAILLSTLGFKVTRLAARVHNPAGLGPLFAHLALRVETPEPWLVDVGFGKFSSYPLRVDTRDDQPDPGGTFRVVPAGDGDLDVLRDGEPQYRVEARPRDLDDFEPTCWWQQTSPKSHFTQSLVCSLLTEDGRVTLSGATLINTVGSDRHERQLSGDAEILAAYETHFGIVLDRVPPLPAPAPA